MPTTITRRDFLKTTGLATLSLPSLRCAGLHTARPNILFIMTDDHGYQAISAYGSKINTTPNIDRLASEGVRFTNTFCTNAICAPARATLLTGTYSHINGVVDNTRPFDGSQHTFPMLLQQVGYETALFGKWHLKSDPTGFDYWTVLPDQGDYYNPDFIEMGTRKRIEGYVTDVTTDQCLAWLRQRSAEKPFCVLLHHKAPHRNFMPSLRHLTLYEDEHIPLPPTFYDDYATRSDAAKDTEMRIADHLDLLYDLKVTSGTPGPLNLRRAWEAGYQRMTDKQRQAWDAAYGPPNERFSNARLTGRDLIEWKYQRFIKDYLRCIASVDDNIGRILDFLEDNHLAQNTIVVYTTDNGFYLGEHGWFDKRFMYEESLRLPLIVRYPNGLSAGTNGAMVLNLDFAPTFLDYAGVAVPARMQGRSLRPLLEGELPSDWRTSMYYHYYEYPGWHMVKRHYGVRTQRYKLIHFYYDIDAWELYDLENDPRELHNVFSDPAYAGVVSGLRKELERLRKEAGDTDEKKYLPEERND